MLTRFLAATAILAALLLGFTPQLPHRAIASDTDSPLQGDVTCDDAVDLGDALDLLRGVGLIEPFASCLSDAGDVDCDNRIDASDALAVFRFSAGIASNDAAGTACSAVGQTLVHPPGSEELISAALAASDITYEESLLDRAYALFDHPDLPEEFRSPRIDYHSAIELFGEVVQNRNTLSAGLLDQLEPFMARPADPISIFNNPPGQAVPASPPVWTGVPAAGGQARVWVKPGPGSAQLLIDYAAEVTRVWAAIGGGGTPIFRYGLPDTPGAANVNPDSAFDFYVVDVGTVDPRKNGCSAVPRPPNCALTWAGAYTGFTEPYTDHTSASYVMISTGLTGASLTGVLGHELIHAGQHAYDYTEPLWLKDSTATWGEFRVLQELNESRQEVHGMLVQFFQDLDQRLTRDTGYLDLTRYRRWLYFLFASMDTGGDGIVTQIWQKAAAAGQQNERAIDEVFPFANHFSDFAVQNWNKAPVDPLYRSPKPGDPTFPADLKPKLAADKKMTGEQTELLGPFVINLSSTYYRYTFDANVRTVTFQNRMPDDESMRVRALVKIGNDWRPDAEDWSDTEVTEYCRDLPDENITEVILIIANADMDAPLPEGIKVQVQSSTTGCEGYVGRAKTTLHVFSEGQDMTYTTNWVRLRFEPKDIQDQPGNVQYDLVAGSGPVNWAASGTYFDCPAVGLAVVGFPGVPYDPVSFTPAGYLNIVGTDGGDFHSILIQAFDLNNTFTVTCPGDPPTSTHQLFPPGHLLNILSEPNTHDGNDTILKGHQVFIPPPPLLQDYTQTYDWELTPVGPVPVP